MLKKTFRFLFTVRPGISPTAAYYSGLFGGAVLTFYVIGAIEAAKEERAWRERWTKAELGATQFLKYD